MTEIDWKNAGLGHLEWCPCGCGLTVGEAVELNLIPISVANHTESSIRHARTVKMLEESRKVQDARKTHAEEPPVERPYISWSSWKAKNE